MVKKHFLQTSAIFPPEHQRTPQKRGEEEEEEVMQERVEQDKVRKKLLTGPR